MNSRNRRYKRGFLQKNRGIRKPRKTGNFGGTRRKASELSKKAQNYYKNEKQPVKVAIIIGAVIIFCVILILVVRGCDSNKTENVYETYKDVIDETFNDMIEKELKDAEGILEYYREEENQNK